MIYYDENGKKISEAEFNRKKKMMLYIYGNCFYDILKKKGRVVSKQLMDPGTLVHEYEKTSSTKVYG